jgi:hypothetical protein
LTTTTFLYGYLPRSSNALIEDIRFKITHPFHPLLGKEFILTTYRNNWGEDRVFFYDEEGGLISLPTQWTNLFTEDPLVCLSTDRSLFRVPDLLELSQLIEAIQQGSNSISLTQKDHDNL